MLRNGTQDSEITKAKAFWGQSWVGIFTLTPIILLWPFILSSLYPFIKMQFHTYVRGMLWELVEIFFKSISTVPNRVGDQQISSFPLTLHYNWQLFSVHTSAQFTQSTLLPRNYILRLWINPFLKIQEHIIKKTKKVSNCLPQNSKNDIKGGYLAWLLKFATLEKEMVEKGKWGVWWY